MELKIEGLSKRYGNGVRALHEVSLTIPAGMFGLLGPNGAGKSTLMRTIAGLQEADAGRVTLGDIDVLGQREELRRVLGYLPQEFGLYPKVSAIDLLDHLALLKGLRDRQRRVSVVEALLRKTNLWDARARSLGTFSGGMKQRFGIAQALIGDPRLIVVDEPTAGLDPEERVRFLNLLSEIGENVVVILSTHIVADVADLCRHMAIIHQGEVVATGDPLQLIAALQGRVWKKFVAKEELAAFMGAHEVISTRRLAGKTLAHVHSMAALGEGFESSPPDLEDVYFHAINARGARAA
jgi:ABC-type multidrug transport system ATPase subunit